MIDTTVNNLIINKLTKEQYDAIQYKSDTELYLIPDEIDTAPTSGSSNPVTSNGIYAALQDKQGVIDAQHKLSADLIEDGSTNKVYTSTDKSKLGGIEAGAQVNVKPDWNAGSGNAAEILNKPTIPTVPTNLSSFTDDLGSNPTHTHSQYLTQHQDISGKEDITAVEAPVNQSDATAPITSLSMQVGKYYRIDVAVEALTVTLPAMSDNSKVNAAVLYLTGGTTPAVTISSTAPSGGVAPDVYYQDDFEIEAGNTYEINCLWNGVAWIVGSMKIVISNS